MPARALPLQRADARPDRAELPADYAALHGEALKRLHAVMALPAHQWEKRAADGCVSISLIMPPGSPHVLVRTEATINMAPERVFAFYMVRAAQPSCCSVRLAARTAPHASRALISRPQRNPQLEKNMLRWAPDVTSREVVRVSPAAAVQHATYRMPPPLDDRDVCVYRASLPGEATRLPGCVRATMAVSIDHDLCGPSLKGVVRAEVLISSTCFVAISGSPNRTLVVSFQHADPRGRIPPAFVARSVGQGSDHLKAVRVDLNALAAMEARAAAKAVK